MRRPLSIRLAAILLGLGLVLGVGGGITYAAFTSTTSNSNPTLTSAADWVAPTASAAIIARQPTGYYGSFIHQNGSYKIYANVSDTGNPASGVNTVTANASNVTTGQTAVSLTTGGCPCSVEGTNYGYRSAALTSNSPLSAGSKTFSITSTDVAGNSGTDNGFSVTVDNTVPAGSDVQTANASSGTAGKAETNDTITYTFSEIMDPDAFVSGWDGTGSKTVTVRIVNKGGAANNDSLEVWDSANTTQLPLGSLDLGGKNYVSGNVNFNSSTMTIQGGGTQVKITLGTASPSGSVGTEATAANMVWTPAAGAQDRAGNACSTANVTESGAANLEF